MKGWWTMSIVTYNISDPPVRHRILQTSFLYGGISPKTECGETMWTGTQVCIRGLWNILRHEVSMEYLQITYLLSSFYFYVIVEYGTNVCKEGGK